MTSQKLRPLVLDIVAYLQRLKFFCQQMPNLLKESAVARDFGLRPPRIGELYWIKKPGAVGARWGRRF
jgi:hypothetical protein